MVKKTQGTEGKNTTFLAFSHPDWFLPYIFSVFICIIMVNTSQFNLMHMQHLLDYKSKRTVLHYGPQLQLILVDE